MWKLKKETSCEAILAITPDIVPSSDKRDKWMFSLL